MSDFQGYIVELFIGVVFLAIAYTSRTYLKTIGKRAHPVMRIIFTLVGIGFIIHGFVAMSHYK